MLNSDHGKKWYWAYIQLIQVAVKVYLVLMAPFSALSTFLELFEETGDRSVAIDTVYIRNLTIFGMGVIIIGGLIGFLDNSWNWVIALYLIDVILVILSSMVDSSSKISLFILHGFMASGLAFWVAFVKLLIFYFGNGLCG